MIQQPGNCPNCGYWDPFMRSWHNPEMEVAEPNWVEEWFPGLVDLLKEGDITVEHEDGDWVYHLTFNRKKKLHTTVERWSVSVAKVGFGRKERSGRKNFHLKRKGDNDGLDQFGGILPSKSLTLVRTTEKP